ncbi:hypothetical protein TNCV_5117301 [Trichonephila clavipes]|nr:hypothetical protein TNCV_5117301 [Trichonephila clavipes]
MTTSYSISVHETFHLAASTTRLYGRIYRNIRNSMQCVPMSDLPDEFCPTNIKDELDPLLGVSAPSFSTIKYWVEKFKRGRTNRREVTTPEMVEKIHKAILDNRRLRL